MSTLTAFLSTILLMIPVYVLITVPMEMQKMATVVLGFVFLFAAALSTFTDARRLDIFIATATYSVSLLEDPREYKTKQLHTQLFVLIYVGLLLHRPYSWFSWEIICRPPLPRALLEAEPYGDSRDKSERNDTTIEARSQDGI